MYSVLIVLYAKLRKDLSSSLIKKSKSWKKGTRREPSIKEQLLIQKSNCLADLSPFRAWNCSLEEEQNHPLSSVSIFQSKWSRRSEWSKVLKIVGRSKRTRKGHYLHPGLNTDLPQESSESFPCLKPVWKSLVYPLSYGSCILATVLVNFFKNIRL